MQAIRLVQLSLLNKRDDFGLAYLLLVSAIEAVAQEAIPRETVKETHPSEETWTDQARCDLTFSELFREYRRLRGQSQYLKERYLEFIWKFAPVDCWEAITPHPRQDLADYVQQMSPGHPVESMVGKAWYEKYPTDLQPEQVRKIIGDSYKHRSSFVHRGKQPPHREPVSYNRFFQELHSFEDGKLKATLLPNYELLLAIAQRSISAWASSQVS